MRSGDYTLLCTSEARRESHLAGHSATLRVMNAFTDEVQTLPWIGLVIRQPCGDCVSEGRIGPFEFSVRHLKYDGRSVIHRTGIRTHGN